MKPAEIQKMGERELDAAIALALGWKRGKLEEWYSPSEDSPAFSGPLDYHFSLDACYIAEERLKEMGLLPRWVEAMFVVIDPEPSATSATDALAQIAHASARQRAEAILMAVQEGETP